MRAESGFFEEALLSFLEQRQLPYLVVARMTRGLKRQCAAIKQWTSIDENYAVGEFGLKLFGWSIERRFVVVREQVREDKAAVGRKLLDVPGYTPHGKGHWNVGAITMAGRRSSSALKN